MWRVTTSMREEVDFGIDFDEDCGILDRGSKFCAISQGIGILLLYEVQPAFHCACSRRSQETSTKATHQTRIETCQCRIVLHAAIRLTELEGKIPYPAKERTKYEKGLYQDM
jgi:hypothetical protein